MVRLWRLLIAWLRRWRGTSERAVPEAPVAAAKPPSPPPGPGVWNFRATVLDRLDEYFFCIRLMRTWAPGDYSLFRRVGAVLLPPDEREEGDGTSFDREPPPLPRNLRPAFGAFMWPQVPTPDLYGPSFVWFQKLKQAPFDTEQAPRGSDVYHLAFLWDTRRKAESGWRRKDGPTWGVSGTFHCYVAAPFGAAPYVLRERSIVMQSIPAKSPAARRCRSGGDAVPHLRLGLPAWVPWHAREHHVKNPSRWMASQLLFLILAWTDANKAGVRVAVRKEGETAALVVALSRAPYFFADRDLQDGRKRRIFHYVRQHERVLRDGRTVEVAAHHRGTRRFFWHGYDITISKPDAMPLLLRGPAAIEVEANEPRPPGRMIGPAAFGNFVVDHIEGGSPPAKHTTH